MGGSESKTSGDTQYVPKTTPQIGPAPAVRIYSNASHRANTLVNNTYRTYVTKK
jgi:hypothetical protein